MKNERISLAVGDKVKKALRKALQVDEDIIRIREDYTLEELAADSVKILDIILALEDMLELNSIDSMLIENWGPYTTVGEIINFAQKNF